MSLTKKAMQLVFSIKDQFEIKMIQQQDNVKFCADSKYYSTEATIKLPSLTEAIVTQQQPTCGIQLTCLSQQLITNYVNCSLYSNTTYAQKNNYGLDFIQLDS